MGLFLSSKITEGNALPILKANLQRADLYLYIWQIQGFWTYVTQYVRKSGKENLQDICYSFLESSSWQPTPHSQVLLNTHAPARAKWMVQPKLLCPFYIGTSPTAEVKVVCQSLPYFFGECTSAHSTKAFLDDLTTLTRHKRVLNSGIKRISKRTLCE